VNLPWCLSRQMQYYAIGGKCSHAGAPLAEGLLHGHTIRCPWHQACFNILTGERKEPPAIDNLPQFVVKISGDDVMVEIPDDAKQQILPRWLNQIKMINGYMLSLVEEVQEVPQ